MSKSLAYCLLLFLVVLLGYSTWQFFCGNLLAGFASLPFLMILYFFTLGKRS